MADDLPMFAPLGPSPTTLTQTAGPGVLGNWRDLNLQGAAAIVDLPGKIAGGIGNATGNDTMRKAAELTSFVADTIRDNQSEQNKAAAGASWIGAPDKPSAWKTPVMSAAMQLMGVAPQIAGTIAAPVAAPAIWGADAALNLSYDTIKEVGAQNDAELRKQYPVYREAREKDVSEEQARKDLIATRAGLVPSLIEGATGALSGVPLGRAAAPAAASVLRRFMTHGAEGAVGNAVGGAGDAIARQTGDIAAGGLTGYDPAAILAAGGEGAVMGGVLGGGLGVFSKQRQPPPPSPMAKPPRDGGQYPRTSLIEPTAKTWKFITNPNAPAEEVVAMGTPPRDGGRYPRTSLDEPTADTWRHVADPYAQTLDMMMPDVGVPPLRLEDFGIGDMTLRPTIDPITPSTRSRRDRPVFYEGTNTGVQPSSGSPPRDGGQYPRTSLDEPTAATWRRITGQDGSGGGEGGGGEGGGGGGSGLPMPSPPTGGAAAPRSSLIEPTPGTWGRIMPLRPGPAVWSTGQHHVPVTVYAADASGLRRLPPGHSTVQAEDGTVHTVRTDQLETVPDFVRDQMYNDPAILNRWIGSLPQPTAPRPGGDLRIRPDANLQPHRASEAATRRQPIGDGSAPSYSEGMARRLGAEAPIRKGYARLYRLHSTDPGRAAALEPPWLREATPETGLWFTNDPASLDQHLATAGGPSKNTYFRYIDVPTGALEKYSAGGRDFVLPRGMAKIAHSLGVEFLPDGTIGVMGKQYVPSEPGRPATRVDTAVPGGAEPASERDYARARPLPERKSVLTRDELVRRVSGELREGKIDRKEARRVAETEVNRDTGLNKTQRAFEIARIMKEIDAEQIRIDWQPEADTHFPIQEGSGRSVHDVGDVKDKLPPRPGSPEDRAEHTGSRPATERELGRPLRAGERQPMVHAARDAKKVEAAARKATDDAYHKGYESEKRKATFGDVETSIGKVFRQSKELMSTLSPKNLWTALAPDKRAGVQINKRYRGKGGAERRRADLQARGERGREVQEDAPEQRQAARDAIVAAAKGMAQSLKNELGRMSPTTYNEQLAVRRPRRTKEEMKSGSVSDYPKRHIARAIYKLASAADSINFAVRNGKMGVDDANRAIDRRIDDLIKAHGELKEQQSIRGDDPHAPTEEQRARSEQEMSDEQKNQDAMARGGLEAPDPNAPKEEKTLLDRRIESAQRIVDKHERNIQSESTQLSKLERATDTTMGTSGRRAGLESEAIQVQRALLAQSQKALEAAEDRLFRLKGERERIADAPLEKQGGASIREQAEEATGRDVHVLTTRRQMGRTTAEPGAKSSKVRVLTGDAAKERAKELLARHAEEERAKAETLAAAASSDAPVKAAEAAKPAETATPGTLAKRYGEPGDAEVASTATAELDHVLADMNGDIKDLDSMDRPRARATHNLIAAIAAKFKAVLGNTPVRVVDQSVIDKALPGSDAVATFQSAKGGTLKGGERGVILIGRDTMVGPEGPHTVLHEVAHAATDHAIEANPGIKRDLVEMGKHVKDMIAQSPETAQRLGITERDAAELATIGDAHEMLAVASTNERLQRAMIEIEAPTRIRAKYGLGKGASVWDGFVNAIATTFHLKRAEVSVLDAVLAINEQLVAYVPPRTARTVADLKAISEGGKAPRNSKINFRHLLGMDRAQAIDKARDVAIDAGAGLGRVLRALAPTDAIVQSASRYYRAIPGDERGRSHADMWADAMQRRDKEASRIHEEEWVPVAQQMRDAYDRYAKGQGQPWLDYIRYAIDETRSRVYGDRTLEEQTKLPTVKGHPAPDNTGRHLSADVNAPGDAQPRANWKDLNERWKALPKDLQALHRKIRDEQLPHDNREMSRGLIGNLIDMVRREAGEARLGDRQREALADRIIDDKLTDPERAVYGKKSSLNTMINEARALKRTAGPYIPQMRDGDHVVHGRFKIDPMGGKQLNAHGDPDARGKYFQFDTEAARRRFDLANKERYTSNHETVYYDKVSGERLYGDEGKKAYAEGRANDKYKLRIEDSLVEFHEHKSEAINSYREWQRMIKAGEVALELDGVEPKSWKVQDIGRTFLDQPYYKAVEDMENSPAWSKMTPSQRTTMKNAMIDVGLQSLGATRIQSKRMKRRNVAGASTDIMANMERYATSSAAYRSQLKYMPKINEHLKALRDELDSKHGLKPEITYPMRALLNELETRSDVRDIHGRQGWGKTMEKGVQRLMQLTNVGRLGLSPAYNITNLLEPEMITAPIINARFGAGTAYRHFRQIEKEMGAYDTLKAGLAETWHAIRKGVRAKDFNQPIKDRFAKLKDGKEIVSLLEEAEQRGGIGRSGGQEFYQILSPSKSRFGRVVDYMDNFSRQMPIAAEAINRTKVLVTGYRAAREHGMNVEQAKHYALELNLKSMGDFGKWNTAPVFENNLLAKAALQFRRYGLKNYALIGRQFHDWALNKDLSKEERAIAGKAFKNTILRHALAAGTAGLPLEPFRVALVFAGLAGFGYSYEDLQADMRVAATEMFGSDVGQIMSGGVPRYLGIDMSTRLGADQWVAPFDPKSNKPVEAKNYIASLLLGASADQVVNYFKGAQALTKGDMWGVAQYWSPLKPMHDIAMMMKEVAHDGPETSTGKKTGGAPDFFDSFLAANGFRSGKRAEEQDYSNKLRREVAKRHEERASITQDYINADTYRERDVAWKRAVKFNEDKAGNERITRNSLERSRANRDKSGRTDEFGVSLGGNDQSLRNLRQYYNVGP